MVDDVSSSCSFHSWARLPIELLSLVVPYVSLRAVLRLLLVDRRLHRLLHEPTSSLSSPGGVWRYYPRVTFVVQELKSHDETRRTLREPRTTTASQSKCMQCTSEELRLQEPRHHTRCVAAIRPSSHLRSAALLPECESASLTVHQQQRAACSLRLTSSLHTAALTRAVRCGGHFCGHAPSGSRLVTVTHQPGAQRLPTQQRHQSHSSTTPPLQLAARPSPSVSSTALPARPTPARRSHASSALVVCLLRYSYGRSKPDVQLR